MTAYYERITCRLCGGGLQLALSLTPTPPANAFVKEPVPQEVFPLDVMMCGNCKHAQLKQVVDPKLLFENYVYVSGTSPSFVEHFQLYSASIEAKLYPKTKPFAVELGSNDGVMLRALRDRGFTVLGVEPAKNIAENARASGAPTIGDFFSPAVANTILRDYGHADVVVANNVLAHVDDLGAVIDGVKALLHHDGLLVFEVQYVKDLLDGGMFDLCLPPKEPIVTNKGVKPIGEICVGDRVLSHLGRFRAVEKVFRRPYSGELIEIYAYGQNTPLRVTPEHPVYVRRSNGASNSHTWWGLGEFLPAKDVRVGYRVLKPGLRDRKKTPWISIETKLPGRGNHTVVTKFRVDKNLMRIFGFYLSEGWYQTIGKKVGKDSAAVEFAFGHKPSEERLAKSCVDAIHAVGGRARMQHLKFGWHVYTYGPLARLLHREFGTGARHKYVPSWIFGLGDNLIEVLIRSYVDGDGYRYRNDRYLRASTVSDQLAQGIALLSNQIGWACSIHKSQLPQKPKTIANNQRPTMNALPPIDILIRVEPKRANKVCFESGYQHGSVHTINRVSYSGEVLNLEVAEDHSYTTPLTAVHNCYHEHVSYHAIRPLEKFLRSHGFKIIDIDHVQTHGGSLRVWAAHALSAAYAPRAAKIEQLYEAETRTNTVAAWKILEERISDQRQELAVLLHTLKSRDCQIVGYGAPAKATTFCYQFGLSNKTLDYIVDDSPLKQGLFTPGLHIPVVPPSTLYDDEKGWPDYVLVLAWNFWDQILEKHKRLAEGGVHFIRPFPTLTVT